MAEQIAYTIAGAVKAAAVSRTEIYRAAQRGDIVFRKRGKRTLILAEDLRRWVEALPLASSKPKCT